MRGWHCRDNSSFGKTQKQQTHVLFFTTHKLKTKSPHTPLRILTEFSTPHTGFARAGFQKSPDDTNIIIYGLKSGSLIPLAKTVMECDPAFTIGVPRFRTKFSVKPQNTFVTGK